MKQKQIQFSTKRIDWIDRILFAILKATKNNSLIVLIYYLRRELYSILIFWNSMFSKKIEKKNFICSGCVCVCSMMIWCSKSKFRIHKSRCVCMYHLDIFNTSFKIQLLRDLAMINRRKFVEENIIKRLNLIKFRSDLTTHKIFFSKKIWKAVLDS